jgi:LmbE family N-acetylglucosaminyl deacetylase
LKPVRDLQLPSGTVVIVAPHMDDEALACGGLIARFPDKGCIHIIYATDGMKSPSPVIPGRDQISANLGEIRMQESRAAMKKLGLSEENLHFLRLPESELKKNRSALQDLLDEQIIRLSPQYILIPFRYDRHPDHLAVNQAIVSEKDRGVVQAQIVEYFVYHRWRLLPKRDIRKYIEPRFLFKVDITEVSSKKRQALDCFESQTTIYYPWQTRPILTPTLLDEECRDPEIFLIAGDSNTGTAIFMKFKFWIRMAHFLEPRLLRWKYLAGAYWKRALQRC